MSHFTVLVIGANPEDQLEPYNENTKVDEYIREAVSEEEKSRCMDYYIDENPELKGKSFEEIYALHGDSWNDNSWRKDEEGVWQKYSTYNPNSKWDWHQLGGRWNGFFKLKDKADGKAGSAGLMTAPAEEGWVDQVMKKDVDFEFMEINARKKAEEHYDKVMELIGNTPANLPWEHFIKECKTGEEFGKARDEYWKQERCVAWNDRKANELAGFWGSPDDFLISRQEYSDNAVAASYTPYAMVYKGKWYQKGDMGWWGISTNEMSESEWNKKVRELIMSLPDNTLLSNFDCHI